MFRGALNVMKNVPIKRRAFFQIDSFPRHGSVSKRQVRLEAFSLGSVLLTCLGIPVVESASRSYAFELFGRVVDSRFAKKRIDLAIVALAHRFFTSIGA